MSSGQTSSLAAISSDLVDLRLPLRPDPGTVVLVFRNGAPVGVLAPGRAHRRVLSLPLTGRLKGMSLATADIPVDVHVEDVALAGTYPLERVTVRLTIGLNPDDDYAALCSYVARKGINFAELLTGEVHAEVDARVRRALAPHTAEAVHRDRAGLDADALGTAPLLDGLFRIVKVVFGSPTWHPGFVEERSIRIEAEKERTRKTLELEQFQLDSTLEQVRDQILEEKARRRNMSLAELENPDLLVRESERRHEVRLGLIAQLDALRRGGGQDAVGEVLRMIADDLGPDRAPAHHVEGQVAADTGSHLLEDRVEQLVGLERLRSDSGLEQLWRAEALPGEPLALGSAHGPAGLTVVVVYRDLVGAGDAGSVDETFRRRTRAEAVLQLDGVGTVEDLVGDYLCAVLPDLDGVVSELMVRDGGDRLIVSLASSGRRMTPFTRRINDPESRLLAPLARVLPYDAVDVRVAEPR